jgi:hypothetical protein
MTITEKLDRIRRRVLNGSAMVNQYRSSWGDKYSFKELDMALSNKKGFGWEEIELITQNDLKTVDRQTLYNYGFGNWDDKLILIPLWLVNFMDQTEEVVSIMDKKSTLADCDKDVRGGCLAYGFYLENENG